MPIFDPNDPAFWDTDRFWRSRISAWDGPADHPVNKARLNLNFHRYPVMRHNRKGRAGKLVSTLGAKPGDRILLMGDVYGWTGEAMAEVSPNVYVSCDNNPLTQQRASETETADLQQRVDALGLNPGDAQAIMDLIDDGLPRARRQVLDEDASNNGSRRRIENAAGGAITHCVTVGMFNFLTDAECVEWSNRLHAFSPGFVGHIVNPFTPPPPGRAPEPPPYMNWKHITEDIPRTSYLDAEPSIAARSWKTLLPNDWFISHESYNGYF